MILPSASQHDLDVAVLDLADDRPQPADRLVPRHLHPAAGHQLLRRLGLRAVDPHLLQRRLDRQDLPPAVDAAGQVVDELAEQGEAVQPRGDQVRRRPGPLPDLLERQRRRLAGTPSRCRRAGPRSARPAARGRPAPRRRSSSRSPSSRTARAGTASRPAAPTRSSAARCRAGTRRPRRRAAAAGRASAAGRGPRCGSSRPSARRTACSCSLTRTSHGSSTISTGAPGVSSKRTARGLLRARCRFRYARTAYSPSRLTGTRRIGRLIAACSCMNPRSHDGGRSIFSSR